MSDQTLSQLDPSVAPDRITAWENLARQAVREYEALKARGEPSAAERLLWLIAHRIS